VPCPAGSIGIGGRLAGMLLALGAPARRGVVVLPGLLAAVVVLGA